MQRQQGLKKSIVSRPPSQRSHITDDQARFFARLINDLEQAFHRRHGIFRDLPEYSRLIEGSYACGFVCRDISPRSKDFHPFVREPRQLETATFNELRRFVHHMMRGERHSDGGGDLGGGLIHEALRCGSLGIIASRLNGETDWRED